MTRAVFDDRGLGYEVLDTRPPRSVMLLDAAFSLDDTMQRQVGIVDYSQRVWAQLPARFQAALRHDDEVVRVAGFDADRGDLIVQRARYSAQMVTNHREAHAVMIDGRRVESLARDGDGTWLPFERSPLVNNLGVAGMVRSIDGRWVVAVRGSTMAYEPGTLGCSASGSIPWRDQRDAWAAPWTAQMIAECDEELGLRVGVEETRFLALTREGLRLGKPQVFMRIDTAMTAASIAAGFAERGDGEHESLRFFDDHTAAQLVDSEHHEGLRASHELRMNLHLALRAADSSQR